MLNDDLFAIILYPIVFVSRSLLSADTRSLRQRRPESLELEDSAAKVQRAKTLEASVDAAPADEELS